MAKSLLKNDSDLVGKVFAQEVTEDVIDPSVSRFMPLERLPSNAPIDEQTLEKWSELGFKVDPETTVDGRRFYFLEGARYQENGTKDEVHINDPNNKFRAEVIDGRLVWHSFGKVNGWDVKGVAAFYSNIQGQRSLIVNSGIHGNSEGEPSVDNNSPAFLIGDVFAFGKHGPVFIHWISENRGSITPDERPGVDILNSYCFSYNVTDFTQIRAAAPVKEMLNTFGVDRTGYPGKAVSDTVYVELGNMKADIRRILDKQSFCYVQGIGGLGKSRIALEIERDVRASISAESDDGCFCTVFVPLKGADFTLFSEHARKVVGSALSTDDRLEKYFAQIGFMAKAMGKKAFVVVDNVDTVEDFKTFKKIFDNLRKFRNQKGEWPFTLLVTGRSGFLEFLKDDEIDFKASVVDVQEYCNENIWEVFSKTFIETCGLYDKPEAKEIIESEREFLLKLFKKYGNHPGHTIVVARFLAKAYNSARMIFGPALKGIDFRSIVEDKFNLIEYDLSNMLAAMLKSMNAEFGSESSKMYEVISLMSDGSSDEAFFHSVLQKYFKLDPERDMIRYVEIINRLKFYGLINYDANNRVYRVPDFYQHLVRSELSKRYQLESEYIGSIFSQILEIINSNLKQFGSNSEKIDENVMYLLNLFNYARTLPDASPMYERVSEMAAQCAKEDYLHTVRYVDVIERYNHFLSEISKKPGYSIEPALYRFMNKEQVEGMVDNLMQKKDLSKQVESLNNIYVFMRTSPSGSHSHDLVLSKIREKLTSLLGKTEEKLRSIVKNNIEKEADVKELRVFPQIKFHPISDQQRRIADSWKRKYQDSPKSNNANLSNTGVDEGLRLLIPYLMEERKIEVIDLSHNYLGNSSTRAVGDLLKYPGSLKEMILNNNSLNHKVRGQFVNIVDGLKNNLTIRKLVINGNSLRNADVQQLCEALKEHPKIEYIELHHNHFDNQGIDLLIQLMRDNPNIKKITVECAWNVQHLTDGFPWIPGLPQSQNAYHYVQYIHRVGNEPVCVPNPRFRRKL